MTDKEIIVEDSGLGTRLDSFARINLSGFSRSYLQEQIKKGRILVNGKTASSDYHMKTGDKVSVSLPEEKPVIYGSNIPIIVLHEDNAILAVNKPSGMVVHPACGNYSDTLVNVLMTRSGIDEMPLNELTDFRFGLVHRLDKETSGVLLIAKTEKAKNLLQMQFAERNIRKEYRAIAEGVFKEQKGMIDCPLKRDQKNRMRMVPDLEGKQAISEFEVLDRFKADAYLRVLPKTGRTHQIRAHLSYIGHPVSGDPVYGGHKREKLGIRRVMLHAYSISFIHPGSGREMKIDCPLPDDFATSLKLLSENK